MAFNAKEYARKYYLKHKEELKQRSSDRHHRLKDDPVYKAKRKLERELRHFGTTQSEIFAVTDGQCFLCSEPADIVHHLNNDGRCNEKQGITPGHDPGSLIPVCRACHIDIHRNEMMTVKKTRTNGYWSRQYDYCVECKTNERKHQAHGLCVNCYARLNNS